MLAEYGGAEWADELAQLQLAATWLRRKRFEAKLTANEVGRLFAGSGGQGQGKSGQAMAGHELLGMAGIRL